MSAALRPQATAFRRRVDSRHATPTSLALGLLHPASRTAPPPGRLARRMREPRATGPARMVAATPVPATAATRATEAGHAPTVRRPRSAGLPVRAPPAATG